MELLKTNNLTKQYAHKDGVVNALYDINLQINKGDFVTVTGASGSGKTTLLLALAGLINPTSGTLTFMQKDINLSSDKVMSRFRNEHIGFVMQNFALIPYLTAIQNVMVPLSISKIPLLAQKEKAKELLMSVGMENRLNHLPKELSAGQQQRVAIARALVNTPSMILADEPTGNLDPSLSTEILELFKEINQTKGITIVMVSHSPHATQYGNKHITLGNGVID